MVRVDGAKSRLNIEENLLETVVEVHLQQDNGAKHKASSTMAQQVQT